MIKICKKCGFAIEIYFLDDGEFFLELEHGDYSCEHNWKIAEEKEPLSYADALKKGLIKEKEAKTT